jgi:hypothetical protein
MVPQDGVSLQEVMQSDFSSLSDIAKLNLFLKVVKEGLVPNIAPLLPMVLSLDGKPYTLDNHFQFESLFYTRMPRSSVLKTGRQVGKSTVAAAHGTITTTSIPYFRTLYITPLFEQVRRLSNNYVKPFIEQSPIKALWTGVNTENSVFQRTFRNWSMMQFSFASLDADRIRGIRADRLYLDETVCRGTMVSTPFGDKRIEDFLPGDQIYAFDEYGRIQIDDVVKCSDHGVNDYYRIELDNGSILECTSDSFIATTAGWKRVSTIIEDSYREADSNAAGYDVGRRKFESSCQFKRKPSVSEQSRLQATRLQHSEVPGITTVLQQSSRESSERRLRRLLEQAVHKSNGGTPPYSALVSPRRQEASDPSLAGPVDNGGNSLVVYGRRKSATKQVFGIPHGGVQSSRIGIDRFLVDAEGFSSKGSRCKESKNSWEGVHNSSPVDGLDVQLHKSREAVHTYRDAIQNRAIREYEYSCMLDLPRDIQLEEAVSRYFYNASLLHEKRMQESKEESNNRQVHVQGGHERAEELEETTEVSGQHFGRKGKVPSLQQRLAQREQGQSESCQAEAYSQETKTAPRTHVDLQGMRTYGATRKQGQQNEVLRSVQDSSHRTYQEGECLEASKIVKITWVGKRHGFDLQVKKYRTFIAGGVAVHNCQDMDADLIPIIKEVMSASQWEVTSYSGTPKTFENTLEGLWLSSSQAEWCVPCRNCNKLNVPSMEQDLERMIGPYRDDICSQNPGTICAKCQNVIFPNDGRWIHKRPERRFQFAGYHLPQPIMHIHYSSPSKWTALLGKREGLGNYTPDKYMNEVLGESCGTGVQLVSMHELQEACVLQHTNYPKDPARTLEEANEKNNKRYRFKILAIDWGGGGEEGVSLTVAAVLGITQTGVVHVLWAKRLMTPHDHLGEANQCLSFFRQFGCDLVAHDYTGAGALRETFLVQSGVPYDRIIPIQYVRAASAKIMSVVKPTHINPRLHYRVDKTRSLLTVCAAIRLGKVKFYKYDYKNNDDPGLIHDFLALVEKKIETRLGSDAYTITRNPHLTDDFAQAVNIGCCSLWHATGTWPSLGYSSKFNLTEEQVKELNPEAPDWDERDH